MRSTGFAIAASLLVGGSILVSGAPNDKDTNTGPEPATATDSGTSFPDWYKHFGYKGEPFVAGLPSDDDGTKWLDPTSRLPCDLTLKTNLR